MPHPESEIRMDADFPGGNIILEAVQGDRVLLRQDLRDTDGDWFYWCFRLRGGAGRTLSFQFTASPALGVRGPACSTDHGKSWRWLGAECVHGNSFSCTIPADAEEIRFSFAMPYLQERWRSFLAPYAGSPFLRQEILCQSKRRREVECLWIGNRNAPAHRRAALTCRHHCCEMMAEYVLEGVLAAVLDGSSPEARWLREEACLFVVPFVDKDGVEDGDQGKNRRPHDHNRDYNTVSIYPETASLRRRILDWCPEGVPVFLDLHCPYIRGKYDEMIYFVGSEYPAIWAEQERFGRLLENCSAAEATGLQYHVASNLPFGTNWNTAAAYAAGRSSTRWAAEEARARLCSSIETPYANSSGQEVNQESARQFGGVLARALGQYLNGING